MPTPSGYQPNPIEELADYIKDWLKSLQVYVDNLAPYPEQDNTLLPLLGIPYQFDTTVGVSCSVKDGSDDYTGWEYGYGNQAVGFLQRVTLMNNSLRYGELNYIGKILSGNPGRWDLLSPEQQDDAVEKCLNVVSDSLIANYTGNVKLNVYISSVGFQIGNYNDSYHIDWTDKNGSHVSANGNPSISFSTAVITEDANGLLQGSFSGYSGLNRNVMQDRTLIAVVNNDTQAQYIVNSRSSVNRDTLTKVCLSGATYKLYYGDNYLVYVVDNSKIYTYYDMYEGTNTAAQQINTWTPGSPVIHVPTYDENKYGPEPEPSDDNDDIDDQVIGAGANLGSIARLWLLTREQLIDLHDAFTSAPANYDPLTSFIGVLGFGVQPIKVVGDSLPWTLNPINIRMSNGELWATHVEGHIVDNQVSAFSFPDIHIKKRYNNFLDYSPYATHEIFIPMCGWLTLPDIAVDRTISVTYLPDIESMKCRAVVSVVDDDGDKCVIGVKDGIMGAEVPFTNLNHSVWLANLITNAADVAGEMVTGAIGAGFTKTTAKGATYRPYEGFTIGMAGGLPGAVGNALLSGNVNRTHVVGSNGNRTGFSDGECIMIKSTYHKIDKPDNYDHTIGKVCNKTGQLSEFNGFTVCDNPHINISALDEEKEEIKRLLEEGVILPSGE